MTQSTRRPRIISPDVLRGGPADRTPSGQTLTAKWPVLHYGSAPKVDPNSADWTLRIFGLCDKPYELSYQQIQQMPAVDVLCDMHCVTHWSRLDNTFTGVSTKLLIDQAAPGAEAKYVMCHGEAGFTVNVPLEELAREDCILAYGWDGKDITPEHGWPLRGLVPRLYLWKSAKWIRGIELRAADAPGFWERNGYHMHGDPWKEERFVKRVLAGVDIAGSWQSNTMFDPSVGCRGFLSDAISDVRAGIWMMLTDRISTGGQSMGRTGTRNAKSGGGPTPIT